MTRRWNGYRNKSLTHKVDIIIIITRVWNGYRNKSLAHKADYGEDRNSPAVPARVRTSNLLVLNHESSSLTAVPLSNIIS